MNIITICVLGIITAILSLTLKRYNSELSIIISITGCILILLMILSYGADIISNINEMFAAANINTEYIAILIKSVGICLLTEFSCDCCNDAGQSALSNNVALAGKILVLITAMPLFYDILKVATSVIGGSQ